VVESFGSTSPAVVGNQYFLFDSTGSGPSLKYAGSSVVTGQFGSYSLIGAEQTASGYDVVWKYTGSDLYSIWHTDSNGDYSSGVGGVTGASTSLVSLEPSFHQDLNGDGVVGLVSTVVESFGSTSPTVVGNQYFLFDSTGSGPTLKYAGSSVVTGQFGSYSLIGAEQTASGYDVVWKYAGSDQYSIWHTDSKGNYTSGVGGVTGASTSLQSLEPSFHQDLNGDGWIWIV